MDEDFKPAQGRSVVYQIAPGVFRPAQIVRVWTQSDFKTVNLLVFLDGSNDARYCGNSGAHMLWKTSVTFGELEGQYLARVPDGHVVDRHR